jgi:metal-responsive CopG/Arc/MetJ family transcriptional regulator
MPVKRKQSPKTSSTARVSISFPGEVYSELRKIADEKKVSVAWVVRDAVSKYIGDRYPLFAADEQSRGQQ